MKFFTNKTFLFKLIVTLCVFLCIFNFAQPKEVNAATGELLSAVGGKLLDPIVDLILVIGDAAMEIFQDAIMGQQASSMYDATKDEWWETALKVIAFVVVLAAVCALTAGIAAIAKCIFLIGGVIASGITSGIVVGGATLVAFSAVSGAFFPDTVVLPTYYIGPEEIFCGKILLFDVNIFNPKELQVSLVRIDDNGNITEKTNLSSEEWKEQKQKGEGTEIEKGFQEQYYFYYDDNNEIVRTSVNSTAQDMKEIIARWYYIIRNIAIIGLLLVLVYVGIRMLVTSVSSEKAKYKQMLADWVIAFCLIFLMQYIMVFANEFVEGITKIVASATEVHGQVATIVDATPELIEAIKKDPQIGDDGVRDEIQIIDGNNINWPTNLTGRMRILAQQKDGTSAYIGYAICFIVLVLYTAFFVMTYLKRLLYILFLTVIAPFVAMTYPLDKIRDGKAQAFEMWMKEYTCNLLIQPFHLLLYTIFVTMAFELAGSNIIYSLVVLGFIMPAERFLRKMFGFDRASTPGFLDGAAGAAMTMTAINSLTKFAGRGANGGKNRLNKGNTETEDNEYSNRGKSRSVQDLINNISRQNGTPDDNVDNAQNDGAQRRLEERNDSSDENRRRMLDLEDERPEQNQEPSSPRTIYPEDEEEQRLREELNNADYNDMYMNPDSYLQKQQRLAELENLRKQRPLLERQQREQEEKKLRSELDSADYNDMYMNPDSYLEKQQRLAELERLRLEDESQRPQEPEEQQPQPEPTIRQIEPQPEPPTRQIEPQPEPPTTQPETIQQQEEPQPFEKLSKREILGAAYRRAVPTTYERGKRNIKKNFKNNFKTSLKGGTRFAAKLTGAVAAGAIGASAGIAAGDLSDVVRNTTAGIAAGQAIGTGVSNTAIGGARRVAETANNFKEETLQEAYGADYSEYQRLIKDEKFMKDQEMRELYARELGLKSKRDIDKAMRDAVKYREYGIEDNDIIIKAMSMDNGNSENRADIDRIGAARLAMDSKSLKNLETTMKRFSSTPGISKEQSKKMEERIKFINNL